MDQLNQLMEYVYHNSAIIILLLTFVLNRIRLRRKTRYHNKNSLSISNPEPSLQNDKKEKVVQEGMCFYYGD